MTQRVLAWAFGFAPVLLILLTWSGNDRNWWIKVYALPVAAVELLVVGAAFLGGMRIRLTPMTACLAGLLVVAWVAALSASDPAKSLLMTELWTLHALFGFASARLFRADDLISGLLAGFVMSVVALAVFTVTAPSDIDWIGELPGLGNPRVFALFAAVAIGLSLGLIALRKFYAVAISTLAFTLVFWSGSRGAILAALVALAVCLLLFPAIRNPRVWGSYMASLVVGAGAAFVIGSPAQLLGVSRIAETGDNGRFFLWRRTIDLIAERPLLGYGEGQTEFLIHIPWTMHPHNLVLQVLLAWGIIGLVLVAILAFWAMRKMLEKVDSQTLPIVCATVGLVAYAQFDGAIYNVHTAAIFAAFIGVTTRSFGPQPDEAAGSAVNHEILAPFVRRRLFGTKG